MPAVAALYQSIVLPAVATADKATDPVPQREVPLPVSIAGNAFIVAIIAVLALEIHPVVVFLASA